jgi:signal transduction histidine kinase
MTGLVGRWSGWWRRHPLAADAVLALLVLAVSLQPLFRGGGCDCAPTSPWGIALVIAECLPLVCRRRFPFTVALITGLLTAVHGVIALPEPALPFAALLAVYTVAAHTPRRLAFTAAAVATVGIAVTLSVDWSQTDLETATNLYLTFATAWLLGFTARGRWERTAELEERAANLERTRAAEARQAVVEERNRIAREMHDVLAHAVSMMVVQAEAGPVVVEKDPARAVQAFDAISATGKQALTELRRLLGVLREDDARPLAPQPGLDQLPDLADQVRRAGVDVELAGTGTPRGLPPAVDLAVYRIVQEALTNVVKHAGPARVTVRLEPTAEGLRVEVADDGPGCLTPGAGRGLLGMRERAASVGGTVTAGSGRDGGWVVTAELPLSAVAHR